MNFSWLNEFRDDRWKPALDGSWYLVMPLTAFLDTSGVRQGDSWDSAFDAWGRQQTRKYSIGPVAALEPSGDLCVFISASMGDWPWPEQFATDMSLRSS
ncbi:hypothetical protein [Lysobacter sp. CA196]|uniref:hypothetical protein n=1 Tax=Lysobacter sp. CA196 TaxID=3455606 RepID=UPI003F8D5A6B